MKISYHALLSKQTVMELWVRQILVSLRFLKETQQIEINHSDEIIRQEDLIKKYIYMGHTQHILKMTIRDNMCKKQKETT